MKSTHVRTLVTHLFLCVAASDFAVGESWGYNKFYKLEYLVRVFVCVLMHVVFGLCVHVHTYVSGIYL